MLKQDDPVSSRDESSNAESLNQSSKVLSVTPITLECKGLNVTVNRKLVLTDVTASFLPYSLTALMGPSGAGEPIASENNDKMIIFL